MGDFSKHFTFKELVHSDNATANKIDNTPSEEHRANLVRLSALLETVRAKFRKPMPISSGYRNSEVNALAGSKPGSMHMSGNAVDINTRGMSKNSAKDLHAILNKCAETFELGWYEYKTGKPAWIHFAQKPTKDSKRKGNYFITLKY